MTREEQAIFGENVRQLRKQHKLTQKELAKIMDIGVHSLQRIEKGDFPVRFSAWHLYRMVEYFHIPADALFYPMDHSL